MKINFDEVLVNIDGMEMTIDGKDKATLSTICRNSLLAPTEGSLSGEEKFKRWELAKKLTGVVDLKVEELSKLKEVVGLSYAPNVVGPAYELLEKIIL